MINKAKLLCIEKHTVRRRFSGRPYYVHPLTVGFNVRKLGESYEIVGYLHDIVEDTDITCIDIDKIFGSVISKAIYAITKFEQESDKKYIKRVYKNEIARTVKIADMLDNIADFYKYGKQEQITKYTKQILYLQTGNEDIL